MSARRTATTVLALAAGGTLALAASGAALPPGGTADQPGTPPGTLAITTPTVAPKGAVGFCVTNIRVDTSGGHVAQRFMLKFDDFGTTGIGPYAPDQDGNLCATVSTDPASYGSSASDKIPADLCDGSKGHRLRLLSGPWAHPEASQRSLGQAFTVTGSCGDGSHGGPTTTPGGGTATGGHGSGSGAAATPVTVRSSRLRADGKRVVVELAGGEALARGTLLLRTRGKVRVGRSAPARRTLARGSYQLAAGTKLSVRLALTADARSLLRARTSLAATLAVNVTGGTTATKNVTVRRARRS